MNIKQVFKEEFHNSLKKYGETLEIFKNPSQKEMRELTKNPMIKGEKSIRYIALPNKTLYVFSSRFVHNDVLRKLELKWRGTYLGGYAHKSKESWKTKSIHNVNFMSARRILKVDWSWLKKYKIKTDEAINKCKRVFLKEEWHSSLKKYGKTLEIFKNPSQQEMRELTKKSMIKGEKSIRYVALPNKTLYVFASCFLHTDVIRKLKLDWDDAHLGGYADKVGDGWSTETIHNINSKTAKKILEKDWSWLKKYKIKTDEAINYCKRTFLKEEWHDTVKINKSYSKSDPQLIEVFKNPTQKEKMEVAEINTLRYIAYYPKKIVYVFSPKVMHWEVSSKMGIKGDLYEPPRNDLIAGIAILKSGKWETERADNVEDMKVHYEEFFKKFLKKDWSWADKYINVSDYLEEIKI